jgi:hypothetical protein
MVLKIILYNIIYIRNSEIITNNLLSMLRQKNVAFFFKDTFTSPYISFIQVSFKER